MSQAKQVDKVQVNKIDSVSNTSAYMWNLLQHAVILVYPVVIVFSAVKNLFQSTKNNVVCKPTLYDPAISLKK